MFSVLYTYAGKNHIQQHVTLQLCVPIEQSLLPENDEGNDGYDEANDGESTSNVGQSKKSCLNGRILRIDRVQHTQDNDNLVAYDLSGILTQILKQTQIGTSNSS